MAEALALRQEPAVVDLLRILQGPKMEVPRNEFFGLLNTVDTLENQLKSILGELNGVRQTLNEVEKRQKHPVREAFGAMFRSLQAKAMAIREQLAALKQAIVEGAKRALAAFKEKGLSALNGIMRFFKIKPALNAIKTNLDGAIESAGKSIAKIDAMAAEVHETGAHFRNIGLVFNGKERVERRENGKLAKALQLPYRVIRKAYTTMRKGAVSVIGRLERLEQAAAKIKEAKQPSLEEKMAAGRAMMEAQTPRPIDPNAKKQEAAL